MSKRIHLDNYNTVITRPICVRNGKRPPGRLEPGVGSIWLRASRFDVKLLRCGGRGEVRTEVRKHNRRRVRPTSFTDGIRLRYYPVRPAQNTRPTPPSSHSYTDKNPVGSSVKETGSDADGRSECERRHTDGVKTRGKVVDVYTVCRQNLFST